LLAPLRSAFWPARRQGEARADAANLHEPAPLEDKADVRVHGKVTHKAPFDLVEVRADAANLHKPIEAALLEDEADVRVHGKVTHKAPFDLADARADAANLHKPIEASQLEDDDGSYAKGKVGAVQPNVACPDFAKYGWEKIKALGGCNAKYSSASIAPFEAFAIAYHWVQVQDGIVCKFSLTSKDHGFTLQVCLLAPEPYLCAAARCFNLFSPNDFGPSNRARCAGSKHQRAAPTSGHTFGPKSLQVRIEAVRESRGCTRPPPLARPHGLEADECS
jgi:hypothetical protein